MTRFAVIGLDHRHVYELTGYLIEKSLAVDNIFVFLMIFTYFSVPPAYQKRVLMIGIVAGLGCLICLNSAAYCSLDTVEETACYCFTVDEDDYCCCLGWVSTSPKDCPCQ